MKSIRKIFSGFLVLAMMISMFIIPANAETTLNFSADFDSYVGTWDGKTVTDTAVMPVFEGGKVETYSYNGMRFYNGVTSGAPENSPYGTSVKLYQEHYAEDGNQIYGGIKYTLSGGASIDDSIYFESSLYTEENNRDFYISKSISFRNYGTGRTNNNIVPIMLSDKKITTYGENTQVPYAPGKWLDFKVWTNLKTGQFKTQIWSDGEKLDEVKGTADVSNLGGSVTQIIWMHRVYSSYTRNWNLDENGNSEPQITYIDNVKVQEVFGFENPDPGVVATFDFEDYKNTTDIKTGPADGVWGNWKWGNSNTKTHGIFAEKTDRGTSLAIVPAVYEGETDKSGNPLEPDMPNGNLTVTNLKYPNAYYDLRAGYKIQDAAYLKTSIRLEDLNFGSARVNLGGINVFTTYPSAKNEYSLGDICIFDDSSSVDTGLNLKLRNWYDIEAMLDVATGYIRISISDGEETYEYKGYAPEGLYTRGTEIYRLNYIFWDRTPKHDWSQHTRMLVDDMKFGSVGQMYVPGEDGGEAPYDFIIDKRFSTTGFDKIIDMTDEVEIEFSNRVNRNTFNANTISVNGTAIDASDIMFVDDQTLKLTFDKTQNKSYKVDFVGVQDIYGNSLTDYITFSTEAREVYISDVRYTRNGEVLKRTTPGNVKVAFDGADYAGKGTEVYFTAAVYNDGRMVSAANETFELTKTETEYFVNVVIPDDTKHYVIKAFAWDASTAEPLTDKSMLTAVQDNIPVSIVKMDALDATYADLELYSGIKEWVEENKVKAAIGFVPRNLDYLSDEDIEIIGEAVRDYYDSDYIEIWDHQYGGINCNTATYEQQIDNLQKATDAMNKIGMEYNVWGPLYNGANEYTADALNAFPNYKVAIIRKTRPVLEAVGMLDEDNNFDVLYEYINVEVGVIEKDTGNDITVPNMIDAMAVEWDKAVLERTPYLLLQWHPDYVVGVETTDVNGVVWGGEGNTMYDQILWFRERGTTFMTPLEYIGYLKNFN